MNEAPPRERRRHEAPVTYHHCRAATRRRHSLATFLFLVVAATTATQEALGFPSVPNSKRQHLLSLFDVPRCGRRSDSPLRKRSRWSATDVLPSPHPTSLQLSTKEEAAHQRGNTKKSRKVIYSAISSGVICLFLHSFTTFPSTIFAAYSRLLMHYPLTTKSLSSGVLCGIGDIIAQFRDPTYSKFNYGRLIRFAG